MDPESNKDGTFKPRNSMVMDRHCETAPFKNVLFSFGRHGATCEGPNYLFELIFKHC